MSQDDDARSYDVVVNIEQQYSVWFADRDLPMGWKRIGLRGPKQECLDRIAEVCPTRCRRTPTSWRSSSLAPATMATVAAGIT